MNSASFYVGRVTEPNMFICEDWFVDLLHCAWCSNALSVPKGVGWGGGGSGF